MIDAAHSNNIDDSKCCDLHDKNHGLSDINHVLNNCYSNATNLKINSIYGFCHISNCLYFFDVLNNSDLRQRPSTLIKKFFLKSKNPLKKRPNNSFNKTDLRNFFCLQCGNREVSEIKYSKDDTSYILKNVIHCTQCDLIYHFDRNRGFIPILTSFWRNTNLIGSADLENFPKYCTLRGHNHILKNCYSKSTSSKLKYIYGYCEEQNCLFIFVGNTNPELTYIPINKLFLKPKDSLKKANLRSLVCSRCNIKDLSNISIYDKKKNGRGTSYILRTAI